MGSYCKHYSSIATTTQGKRGELWFTRGRCKQWSCGHCAYINRQLWSRKIIWGIGRQKRKYWWFVTLTASSKAHYSNTTLKNLQSAWKRLYDRLRRKFWAYSPVYVWVFEPHKTGELHIHALMSFNARCAGFKKGKLDKHGNDIEVTRWFKDTMASLGAGYQASCKPLDNTHSIQRRAGYVVKYMTKTNQGVFEGVKRFRFVHTSQHFSGWMQGTDLDWKIWSGIGKDDLKRFIKIKDLNRNKYLTDKDFEHTNIYPPELE